MQVTRRKEAEDMRGTHEATTTILLLRKMLLNTWMVATSRLTE